MLALETLLLSVFLVLDILLFYIFFETILPPLFLLIGLFTSLLNLFVSLLIFIFFDFSINQFQFVQEHYEIGNFDIYLGIDGISIYFVLLTTIIMPIAILSN